MASEIYESQVDLLLEVMPVVAKHRSFAIKGGTAINLFYLDMPRLSVDIDLCYLPVKDRDESFQDIHGMLSQIKTDIEKSLGFTVHPTKPLKGEKEARLNVSRDGITIKIEPNYVLRGCLFDPQEKDIALATQERFKKSATAFVLDQNDLYGGKFCAALDRQHPRDLFDVHHFFKTQHITPEIKDAFLFYLLSHNRPMHELLNARDLPIEESFEKEFRAMTRFDITVDDLVQARKNLRTELLASFDDRDKQLLMSFANKNPDWGCYRHSKIKDYPSIRWKLHNLGKVDLAKRDQQSGMLEQILTV